MRGSDGGSQKVQASSYKVSGTGDAVYSMMTVVDHCCAVYLKLAKRVDPQSLMTRKKTFFGIYMR